MPPPGPTSPCWASRIRMPSSTPAGILTVSERRVRTRPSPAQVGARVRDDRAVALAGRCTGRAETTWPRKVRCTDWTSPRPPQVSQVAGWVPARRAGAGAGGAEHRGVDGDRRLDAERGLVQVELEPQDRVGAGPGTRARARGAAAGAAEERVHDVLEADERAGAAGPPGRRRRPGRAGRRPGRRSAASRSSERTSYAALISLNFSCASGSGLTSGWYCARQLAVGALDLVVGGVPAARRECRSSPWPLRSVSSSSASLDGQPVVGLTGQFWASSSPT